MNIYGVPIIESPGLMQTWQLDDWTKEMAEQLWFTLGQLLGK